MIEAHWTAFVAETRPGLGYHALGGRLDERWGTARLQASASVDAGSEPPSELPCRLLLVPEPLPLLSDPLEPDPLSLEPEPLPLLPDPLPVELEPPSSEPEPPWPLPLPPSPLVPLPC